jgi:hypothetical protein
MLLAWGVRTRSGFAVEPAPGDDPGVRDGAEYWLAASVGRVALRAPAPVVAVVDRPDRCGFADGTLEGHPVPGEEAFVLHRGDNGVVRRTADLDDVPLADVRELLDRAFAGDLADEDLAHAPGGVHAPVHAEGQCIATAVVDALGALIRTPEGDGSVFVPPGALLLDRRGEFTCDWRAGDVW